jgi:hypothetical protein
METLLVRLKPYDPRRGFVLRRFTFKGVKFHEERGWYRVPKPLADYLSGVKQVDSDLYSPLAFDIASDDEAKAVDAREESDSKTRKNANEAPRVATGRGDGRGDLTGEDLRAAGGARAPAPTPAPRPEADKAKKDRV